MENKYMTNNTDKPMELREKIEDVVNQMLNRNNFEFETRVEDLEKIVSQAIQATREETRDLYERVLIQVLQEKTTPGLVTAIIEDCREELDSLTNKQDK